MQERTHRLTRPEHQTHAPPQEQFYDALDGATNLVDTYILRSANSEAEQRRLQVRTHPCAHAGYNW